MPTMPAVPPLAEEIDPATVRFSMVAPPMKWNGATPCSLAPVPVVVLTHAAKAADLEAALKEIEASGVVGGAPVKLRML